MRERILEDSLGAVRSAESHGMSKTKVYRAWVDMRRRCYTPESSRYNAYGARGIVVCERWKHSFVNFFDDMGHPPEGTSLERRDNNGNYNPENCVWATWREQYRNRSTNKMIEHDGRLMPLCDWAEEIGIPDGVLRSRIRRGWAVERAFYQPIGKPRGIHTKKRKTKDGV